MSIDWSKPVRHTKSHDPVRVLCTDRPGGGGRYPVVLLSSSGVILSSTLDGCVNEEPVFENIPETVEIDVWINVYEGGAFWVHRTRSSADAVNSAPQRIACINVKRTVEVGEGLNK